MLPWESTSLLWQRVVSTNWRTLDTAFHGDEKLSGEARVPRYARHPRLSILNVLSPGHLTNQLKQFKPAASTTTPATTAARKASTTAGKSARARFARRLATAPAFRFTGTCVVRGGGSGMRVPLGAPRRCAAMINAAAVCTGSRETGTCGMLARVGIV